MDVSTHDNISHDIVTALPYSKGNKDKGTKSSKAAPSNCELIYDPVESDSGKQTAAEKEELPNQLYEIPDLKFGMRSTGRDAEESYIYY